MSRIGTLILRICAFGLILLALLDPRPFLAQGASGAVLILDVSASMGSGREEPPSSLALRKPWLLVADGVQEARGSAEAVKIGRQATRLEEALRQAAIRFPASDVLLVSDGRETHGDALAGARAVAAAGGRLFTQAPQRTMADLALLSARVLTSAPAVRIGARVSASTGGRARLELLRMGSVVDRIDLEFVAGDGAAEHVLVDRDVPEGRQAYQVTLHAETGTPNDDLENDRLDVVRLSDERVVEIWGDVPLEPHAVVGITVRRRGERGLPLLDGVDLVVLSNLPWAEIGTEGTERLTHFVAGGGRLLVLGGPDAYGPGGWTGTPLEANLLPLRSVRPEGTQLALLLVLDRSGSTQGRPLAHLTGAAARVGFGAAPGERVAVLTFAQTPDLSLLSPGWLDGRSALAEREALREALTQVVSGGGTDLPAALLQGARLLSEEPARQRRLLLLSDGDPDHPPDEAGLRRAREELERGGIRAGALIVGDAVAATRLREWVAMRPQDVVELRSPEDLPEALLHWLGAERAQREVIAGPSSLMDLVAQFPQFPLEDWRPTRMHRLELTPGSAELLRAQGPTALGELPFAARRAVGAGEVHALAWGPELEDPAHWSREMLRLSPGLISLAQSADRGLVGDLEQGRLIVLWPQQAGAGQLLAVSSTGERVALVETSPGRFEGEGAVEVGSHTYQVLDPSQAAGARPLHLPARPAAEHLGSGVDVRRLADLAKAGGGQRLGPTEVLPPPALVRGPSQAHWLLLAALILLLVDRSRVLGPPGSPPNRLRRGSIGAEGA